jgi:hypothetical protein
VGWGNSVTPPPPSILNNFKVQYVGQNGKYLVKTVCHLMIFQIGLHCQQTIVVLQKRQEK